MCDYLIIVVYVPLVSVIAIVGASLPSDLRVHVQSAVLLVPHHDVLSDLIDSVGGGELDFLSRLFLLDWYIRNLAYRDIGAAHVTNFLLILELFPREILHTHFHLMRSREGFFTHRCTIFNHLNG
jgi:hypothetical protein